MMKTYVICPISDKLINERVARFNAAFSVVLIVVFGLTQSIIPIAFLLIDFLMRSTQLSNYSLIGLSSKGIVKYFSINEYLINAGPKIFAARLGLVMSSIIIIAVFLDVRMLAYILASILGLFSFLEAAFSICVACKIYPVLYNWLYRQQ
jgi:hypothetical protein